MRLLAIPQSSLTRVLSKLRPWSLWIRCGTPNRTNQSFTNTLATVECRITYKLMVLVYKCVNGTAPAYLCRLIQPKCRDSRLRQPSDLELHRPVPKKAIGTAAFGFVGPDRWNQLPERLRESASLNIFKRDLKTHLFSNPL